MTLDELLAAARVLPTDLPLVFETEDGPVGAGYHVTEFKLANVISIDCGARTSSWTEAIMQLLDGQGRAHMPIGKFSAILAQSLAKVDGLGSGPAFVEFGHRNAGMQIFEPTGPETTDTGVTLRLKPVRARCKPAQESGLSGRVAGCGTGISSSCCA